MFKVIFCLIIVNKHDVTVTLGWQESTMVKPTAKLFMFIVDISNDFLQLRPFLKWWLHLKERISSRKSHVVWENNYIYTVGDIERSGSVVECLSRDQEMQVRASLASLRCIFEQDTVILA